MNRLVNILRNFRDDDDGVATAWSLLFVFVFFGIGGIAVDYTNGVNAQTHLQVTTDAAALTAVQELRSGQAAAKVAALETVEANAPSGTYGTPVAASDIIFGTWDSGARTFTSGIIDPNAAMVSAYRNQGRDNSLKTLLLRLVSLTDFDVSVSSIAMVRVGNCSSGGFFSETEMIAQSVNGFVDRFCLYGSDGVEIQSNNVFEPGTNIAMNDLSDFIEGGRNNVIPDGTLTEAHYKMRLLDGVDDFYDELMGNVTGTPSIAGLPDYITTYVEVNRLGPGDVLVPGTLYVVSGNANLGANRTIEDVAVVASGMVRSVGNVIFRDALLFSNTRVWFGSQNEFGDADFCTDGHYSVYAFSKGSIEFGSSTDIQGMQMAATTTIDLGSSNAGMNGVYAEAGGIFDFGSASDFGGCPDGLEGEVLEEYQRLTYGLVN